MEWIFGWVIDARSAAVGVQFGCLSAVGCYVVFFAIGVFHDWLYERARRRKFWRDFNDRFDRSFAEFDAISERKISITPIALPNGYERSVRIDPAGMDVRGRRIKQFKKWAKKSDIEDIAAQYGYRLIPAAQAVDNNKGSAVVK